MNKIIEYSTVEQQIEKLKSQNLHIEDEEHAKISLSLFGYSNLIKSYREPYILTTEDGITYRSDVSFEQIRSLHMLDKNIRNAVMASMQDLEEHIKEIAANVVAQSFGIHQDDYLKYNNYKNKKKRISRFTLGGILDTMKNTLNTDKEPIHHYYTKYGMVPPWILFKSIYFSTMINFIDLLKDNEQKKMALAIYGNELGLPQDSLCKLMMDTLFTCIDYRNLSAHGGRIYNYNSPRQLRTTEIFGSDSDTYPTGFSKLLFLLSLFNYQNPFMRLESTLKNELARHCGKFPQDITYLGQILNINIIPKTIVYISANSKKYHSNPHCSGIKNTKEITIEDAKKDCFIPCKRCCK